MRQARFVRHRRGERRAAAAGRGGPGLDRRARHDLNDAFDLSQPTISHHLKVLHDAGLLDRDKRGVWAYYRIRTEALASVAALIAYTRATA